MTARAEVGAWHLRVEGQAFEPYRGMVASAWALAAALGLELALMVSERFAVALEGVVRVALPHFEVRSLAEPVGTLGRPGGSLTLTLAFVP